MEQAPENSTNSTHACPLQACPLDSSYEYNHADPVRCTCAAPIRVGYRLKSPGFSYFRPYTVDFKEHVTSGLGLNVYQLNIDSAI